MLRCIVPSMINDLESIAWASLGHAYWQAGDVPPQRLRDMALSDDEIRAKAFSSVYGAAHHQGACTRARWRAFRSCSAWPDSPSAPDRASAGALIVSIGREAVDRDEASAVWIGVDGEETTAYQDAAALVRGRGEVFAAELCAYARAPIVYRRPVLDEDPGLPERGGRRCWRPRTPSPRSRRRRTAPCGGAPCGG